MTPASLRKYVGKYVRIKWADEYDDWPYFTLLCVGREQVFLRGEDYPDGSAKHDGGELCTPASDIGRISTVRRVKS